MKIFYPEFYYDPAYRMHLFPLLRPIVSETSLQYSQRVKMFSVSGYDFFMTSELSKADKMILPMSWNYYLNTGKKKEAMKLIKQAEEAQKPIWIVLLGDVGFPVPDFNHVQLFRASGYFSNLPNWHHGLPIFISDPLQYNFSNEIISFPLYKEKPEIGFCGFASSSRLLAIKQLLKIAIKNTAFYFKAYEQCPEVFLAAPYLRYQCLKRLEESRTVQANFIMNKKYRAGVKTSESRNRSTQIYYKNMAESQYILCIRGAGNFSVRLYETLAMGRIPIYLHTDGLLPLPEIIDWKQHVVWVDWHERFQIAEKVVNFHKRLNRESIKALGAANRELWETHLQMGAFFKKYLNETA